MAHDSVPHSDAAEVLAPRRAMLAGLGGLAAGAFLASTAQAGPLTPPPGPIQSTPGPEPRIPINQTNTPGDANSVFRISQPGSYYLTGKVGGEPGKSGIEIAASNVTLDLMGFALAGAPGTLDGVAVDGAGRTNITVRNGSVTGWGGDGIDLRSVPVTGGLVESVRASSNTARGIAVGDNFIVRDCWAYLNGIGLSCEKGCSVSRCIAQENGNDGFRAGEGCTVQDCSARDNGSEGIVAENGSLVTDCMAYQNQSVGIIVNARCLVHANACGLNGVGIQVAGPDCRIERNNCVSNTSTGILVEDRGSFIASNTCSGNATNWNIAAMNKCLVINATSAPAINGDSGGLSPGSSDPNANYTY